jgi:hypothetical protein
MGTGSFGSRTCVAFGRTALRPAAGLKLEKYNFEEG